MLENESINTAAAVRTYRVATNLGAGPLLALIDVNAYKTVLRTWLVARVTFALIPYYLVNTLSILIACSLLIALVNT